MVACESEYVRVLYGVPQGTVLGPCSYVSFHRLYILMILMIIFLPPTLFADHCIIYQTIKSEQDHAPSTGAGLTFC